MSNVIELKSFIFENDYEKNYKIREIVRHQSYVKTDAVDYPVMLDKLNAIALVFEKVSQTKGKAKEAVIIACQNELNKLIERVKEKVA